MLFPPAARPKTKDVLRPYRRRTPPGPTCLSRSTCLFADPVVFSPPLFFARTSFFRRMRWRPGLKSPFSLGGFRDQEPSLRSPSSKGFSRLIRPFFLGFFPHPRMFLLPRRGAAPIYELCVFFLPLIPPQVEAHSQVDPAPARRWFPSQLVVLYRLTLIF